MPKRKYEPPDEPCFPSRTPTGLTVRQMWLWFGLRPEDAHALGVQPVGGMYWSNQICWRLRAVLMDEEFERLMEEEA